jgi:tetratricopeptide (TPR) repeat protein
MASGGAGAADPPALQPSAVAGLADFLQARVYETGGQYREAVEAYQRAVEAAPEIQEVRIRFASLLLDLGLADRAVEVIGDSTDLDWYGRRVLALALAQESTADPASLQRAESALRDALADRDDDPNLQLSLGQVLYRMGRVADAEEVIAELRRTRGGSPQLAAFHAGMLRQLGRRSDALEVYAECAAVEFLGGVDCRENLVQLLIEMDRPGEAGQVMLRWLDDSDLDDLMRAASLLYEGGLYEEALDSVQRVLRADPDAPRARALEAFLLAQLGRYSEAVAKLEAIHKKQRNDLDVLISLAWATANTGDLEEAREWIGRAWEVVQEDAASDGATRVALSAARVELVADNTWRAREWLERVADPRAGGSQLAFLLSETFRRDEAWQEGVAAMLRLQPKLEGSAQLEARAYEAEFRLRMGDPGGTELLRPLLESDNRRDVLLGLGVLQGVERWADVDREADAALGRFPDDRDLVFNRAAALERLDRVDESAELFNRLVEADPDDAAAANYLGYTWADRGDHLDRALELITRAVALEPENPAYLDSLGWVHYRLGDLDQAEYWLRRAIGLGGTDGTVLSHLGEVLLRKGEIDEARLLLRQALDSGTDHPDHVRELLEELEDDR